MLTKSDLKAIDSIVVKRTAPIQKGLVVLDKKVGSLDKKVGSLDKKVNNLDKKVDRNFVYLKKRFDELFNHLDKKYLEAKRDIRNIQSHLRLPVSDF